MNPTRRDCFRWGLLGLGSLGTARFLQAAPPLNFPAGPMDKLLVVFLRGGMDGVHTVVPIQDSTYVTARGSLALGVSSTVPLSGTSYARLNANYAKLADGSSSPDQKGNIAWMCQIGNPSGTRSHFAEMDSLEGGVTTASSSANPEGLATRLAVTAGFPSNIRGASISHELQRMFRSSNPSRLMAHIKEIKKYDLGYDNANPLYPIHSNFENIVRTSMAAHLNQTPVAASMAEYLDATGEFLLASESVVSGLQNYTHDPLFPISPAEAAAPSVALPDYAPGYYFAQNCEEAYRILLGTPCRIAGVEFGGWDTHENQAATRAILDKWLAHLLRVLYDKFVNGTVMDHITILVVSEFGRTNFINTVQGTDHGIGNLMMAIGRKVKGGVYNCKSTTGTGPGAPWKPLTSSGSTSQFDNAQEVVKDQRTILAELFRKRFGVTATSDMNFILPGFSSLSGPQYTELDYLLATQ